MEQNPAPKPGPNPRNVIERELRRQALSLAAETLPAGTSTRHIVNVAGDFEAFLAGTTKSSTARPPREATIRLANAALGIAIALGNASTWTEGRAELICSMAADALEEAGLPDPAEGTAAQYAEKARAAFADLTGEEARA